LEILVIEKVFVVMLCHRPIQRLSDDRSVNLNLYDHVRFARKNMTMCYLWPHWLQIIEIR